MASLERRGTRFRVAFRYGERKLHVSLKTADGREAEGCRARIEENLRLVERGRLTVPLGVDLGLFLLTDGKLERKPVLPKVVTLGTLFAQYRATFVAGVKEKNTAKTEAIHLNHVERLLGSKTTVDRVGTTEIQGYVETRSAESYRGRTINPVTVKKEVATLKFVWNWAHRLGHAPVPYPAVGIVFPKGKQKEPFRTFDQIQEIIDRGGLSKREVRELWDSLFLNPREVAECLEHVRLHSHDPWLYPFLFTAAHTGARRSELFRAKVMDFDFASRVFHVREKKKSRSKETIRYVDLTPQLERVVRDFFASGHPGGLVAFCSVPDEPVADRESRTAFRRAFQGSKWKVIRGFHTFRHSFASNLAAGRVDHRIIDELMGHQTVEMQRRYRHLFPEVRRAALTTVYGES